MKLKALLLKMEIDLTTNKSVLANQLKADLANENYYIDFEKDDQLLTDQDCYQIGRSLWLPANIGKPYTQIMLINLFKDEIHRVKTTL